MQNRSIYVRNKKSKYITQKPEQYVIISEKYFKDLLQLYRFYKEKDDYYSEKYNQIVGRVLQNKDKTYKYIIAKNFIALELERTHNELLVKIAQDLGMFNDVFAKMAVEYDKYLHYLFDRTGSLIQLGD